MDPNGTCRGGGNQLNRIDSDPDFFSKPISFFAGRFDPYTSGMTLISISRRLAREADRLRFLPPVTHIYNPLVYAQGPAEEYLRRHARPSPEGLLLGMNPGPFGMAQTGIPFGEVGFVRDWMRLKGRIGRPDPEHPKRPVLGFDCPRSEVSGRRLYGWARERFGTPEAFFARFFVWNYCPLVFLEAGGKNRTPDKLPAAERSALFALCDRALVEVVELLRPQRVIGIGRFATDRARAALRSRQGEVATILHPSPASPLANRGWARQVEEQLAGLGIDLSRE
ncbi:MAG: uracil-DNA glycosylase family protein [Planctomycetota bacterium]